MLTAADSRFLIKITCIGPGGEGQPAERELCVESTAVCNLWAARPLDAAW